jgi:predicted transcriptional regulator
MERTPQAVTDAELAVLQVLWDRGSATARQLTDTLYPGGAEAHYATVKKLLERLEAKGHVARDRSGHAHLFTATTDLDTIVAHHLRSVAQKLCGGLMTPLLSRLLRARALTRREREDLRALMDELDRENRPKNERR